MLCRGSWAAGERGWQESPAGRQSGAPGEEQAQDMLGAPSWGKQQGGECPGGPGEATCGALGPVLGSLVQERWTDWKEYSKGPQRR